MAAEPDVRDSAAGDLAALAALYPDAFPAEDLWPLVGELLRLGPGALSLVVTEGATLVGHAIFTICRVGDGADPVALLGPLAVARPGGAGGSAARWSAPACRGWRTPARPRSWCSATRPTTAGSASRPRPWSRRPIRCRRNGATPRDRCVRPGGSAARGRLVVPGPWRQPGLWAL